MKKYTAAVRDSKTKKVTVITSEYKSKKDFRQDLNRNGYTVIGKVTEA